MTAHIPHIPHIHAESMMLYAEDAAKTAKPWELWEFISFGMEDWQTLDSNPNWGFSTDYRRKIKMADPQADALDAECFRFWVSEAARSPAAMAKLIMHCTAEDEFREAISQCIASRQAAIAAAKEKS